VKTKILVPTNCVRLVTDYLEIDANLVVDEAHITNDLGVDWLDQIESLIMIEDKFEKRSIFRRHCDRSCRRSHSLHRDDKPKNQTFLRGTGVYTHIAPGELS
jgi:hypothetical protein